MRSRLAPVAAGLLPLVLLIVGCEHGENYRWSSHSNPTFTPTLSAPTNSRFEEWEGPSVSVYSYPTPTPAPSETALRDLSDQGQAALIEAYSARAESADELRALLATPLRSPASTPSGEAAATAEGVYKRTLVANVTEGWSAAPGDRLVWTWIHIRPVNFVFDGYTVLATDNQVLNIEQITNATTLGANATLGRTGSETSTTNTAGTPVSSVLQSIVGSSAGLTGTLNHTNTTTAAINQQYVKLGADIVPTELRIYRESERNQDVAGNTLIALTMRVDPEQWVNAGREPMQRVTNLALSNDGALRAAADVEISVVRHLAPPRCPLIADVTLYYQARRVADGRSYIEGEQDARYEQGQYDAPGTIIVPAGEVRASSWRVYPVASPTLPLQLRDVFGSSHPLDFSSLEQARNFAEWISRSSDVRGRHNPRIGSQGLELSSGADHAIFDGPYFVERVREPNDLADQCAGMATRTPAA